MTKSVFYKELSDRCRISGNKKRFELGRKVKKFFVCLFCSVFFGCAVRLAGS